MKLAKHSLVVSWTLAISALGGACAVDDVPPPDSSGNAELGIARFEVTETETKSTVIGLDADGAEIGRMELVHGRFTLSAPFIDDYDTAEVDGRALSATVDGERFWYETAGYEPLFELPPEVPGRDRNIAMFLLDPHAQAILDRWQLGFKGLSAETSYGSALDGGYNLTFCDNSTTCGTTPKGTINTCGGGATSQTAYRVLHDNQVYGSCGWGSGWDQWAVHQCCPAGSGGQSTRWYALKTCPNNAQANTSQCGTTSAVCKGCGALTAATYCSAHVSPGGGCGAYPSAMRATSNWTP